MDDQQAKTGSLDLAWLAGFFDGEASFMMTAHRPPGAILKPYFIPRITVVNTDEPTLAEVMAVLRALGLAFYVSRRTGAGGRLDAWDLRVMGLKRCRAWCSALTPALRTKHGQAEAMLGFCDSRLALNGVQAPGAGRPYSARERELIESLRGRFRKPQRLHARPA